MSISRYATPTPPTLRTRVLETLALAVVFGFIPELATGRAGVVPHAGWIAVVILAARYGGVGLMTGLITVGGAVAFGSAAANTGSFLWWSRFEPEANLIALGGCVAVAWIASVHLRRQSALHERLARTSYEASDAQAVISTLQDVVGSLRSRVDRTSASLSFLRDVAGRLDGSDPVAAAEAAADLALVRAGAFAAEVRVGVGGGQRPLAVRDARGPRGIVPLVFEAADTQVPIRDGSNQVGAIALWGVPSPLDDATSHDVAVIASWCAPALAVAAWCQEDEADHPQLEAM